MRNWHGNQRTRVPHNDQFRNLWRPREGRCRRPRSEVLRNKRARYEREEPEQPLYMSDDETDLVEVTHEEDSSNPKPRKPRNLAATADMTGIDRLGKKKVTITFEPLWDEDGRRKDPRDYQKRLGEAHPVLTQAKEWKKVGCMDWCRANPGKERWLEGGSGYFRSNVAPAASYTGSTTDTDALSLHLRKMQKGGNYSAIAQLYCTGQVTITLHGYVCNAETAAADQEQEQEQEEQEEQEEEEEEEEEEAEARGEPEEEEEDDEDGESSTDDAEEKDPLIAEARKYPALKRKADELEAVRQSHEAVRQSLRQDVEAEKEKAAAAAAEAAAVEEEVTRVEYETVQRIKRAKVRPKYISALEHRARSQHRDGELMCECGCKTTFFGGKPLELYDMEVDHENELADGGADDPGIDGLTLLTRICHGRKTRARALERIRAKQRQS